MDGLTTQSADPVGAAAPAEAVEEIAGDPAGGLLLVCDHASNRIPAEYADLGLPHAELARHIAYDIGVASLTRELAARFNAPAVLSCFSRLLIDPNRGEDDPTLIMRLSDGAVVPGNARFDCAEREARLQRFYRPYHVRVSGWVDRMLASRRPPAILSIHSYTPVWKAFRRPWHAAILWDRDPRLAVPLLEGLRAEPGLVIGDNEPYHGALKNDTIYRHATLRGLPNALIEVRQDLIDSAEGVREWSARLDSVLRRILSDPALTTVRRYGSDADSPHISEETHEPA